MLEAISSITELYFYKGATHFGAQLRCEGTNCKAYAFVVFYYPEGSKAAA